FPARAGERCKQYRNRLGKLQQVKTPDAANLGDAHLANWRRGTSTESPLPLWERDRVRGLAPAGAEESVDRERPRHFDNARQLAHCSCIGIARSLRGAARVPPPCPSPTRGEGTL